MTATQARVLRALALDLDAAQPPVNVLARLRPDRLAGWLAQPAFSQRLARLLEGAARRREIAIALAAARAAEQLASAAEEGAVLDEPRRRACAELITLARTAVVTPRPRQPAHSSRQSAAVHTPDPPVQDARARGGPRRRAKPRPDASVPKDLLQLIHPDLPSSLHQALLGALAPEGGAEQGGSGSAPTS